MNYRRARDSLDALAAIESHRVDLRAAVRAITDVLHGPQGVSSDCRLLDQITALFDGHVDHLVKSNRQKVIAALEES